MRFWGCVWCSVACVPNASCLEENQPAAKPRTVCRRAAESTPCPQKPSGVQLLSRRLIDSLLNLSQETPLDIVVVPEELWEEQAVFGGCWLCCQWRWCNKGYGSTTSTCLHGRTRARQWRRALPIPGSEEISCGWPCSGTKRGVLPSTTILLGGLRPFYILLFYFRHTRDFWNIILLPYYAKSTHLYVMVLAILDAWFVNMLKSGWINMIHDTDNTV